uniref:Potassium channel blocker pMeKTx6-2 n=1 Tax=Mesobuthus eupeus TaxID=34648 RepID=A0A088DB32_MESEU|nr:potassium channel blocker pMeKTx6-2 [Mesobuthus eupeus]
MRRIYSVVLVLIALGAITDITTASRIIAHDCNYYCSISCINKNATFVSCDGGYCVCKVKECH